MSTRQKPLAVLLILISLALTVATPAVAADPLVHIVEKGETFYAIARRYDVSVETLMKSNGVEDAGRLFVGMKLTIPLKQSIVDYVVKKGDTLYGIAKAHGASVNDIVKASSMTSTTIKIGQKLRIPALGGDASVPPSVPSPSPVARVPASTPATQAPDSRDSSKSWPASGTVAYLQGKLKGVSIATQSASPITAIRAGTVISAGPFRGFDQVAFVQSSDGLVYVYGGAATLSVRVGDSIRKGSMIGKVSSEREASVYFFVFKGADTLDPNTVPRD
ncbi:MAG: LysM peptidoglycan-binding domain-containing protein [Spirochaetia bacterium]|jgi:LysM repeat protein|nr:LysM peptidoglycan-binding domain-containing protein [Spirochaetia bacterium]